MNSAPAAWPPALLSEPGERRFSVVIIGDVGIEFRAQLTDRRFAELREDHLSYAPAHALVSGTAVNLARTSAAAFRAVAVLGRIGDDVFTPVIRQSLRDLGVRDLLTVRPGMPNACTMMLRDRPADGGAGVRLLVAGDTAPSRFLTAEDVHRQAGAIEEADALFLDGYSLLSPVSRTALLAAAGVARSAGTLVAFDLVPHDIDARLDPADVRPVLDAADVVISGAGTLARLLRRPPVRESADVRDLLKVLEGDQLWLLRFGATGMEHVAAYQRDTLLLEYPTGYGVDGQHAGYGDRLAVSELYWWLARNADR